MTAPSYQKPADSTTNHEKKMLIWRGGYWEEHPISEVKILLDRIPEGATHYIQASIEGEPHFYKEVDEDE